MDPLFVWVIYEKPKDFPQLFVARMHRVTTKNEPTDVHVTGKTLYECRQKIPGLYNLTRIPRDPQDDACIVESWI